MKLDAIARLDPLKAACIVFVTAVACEIGFILLRQGFWLVTPIWPPVGVALAAYRWVGTRAWPWLVLGHCWVLIRLDPTALWALWIIPVLYPFEAWLAARLSQCAKNTLSGPDDTLMRLLCMRFLSPAIAAFPCMGAMAAMLYLSGFSGATMLAVTKMDVTFPALWVSLFLSHLLALITFGPLLTHLVRGEAGMLGSFQERGHHVGLTLACTALMLMALGFSGLLTPPLSPQAVVMLPVPLFFIAALWLNSPQATLLSTLSCFISLYLAGMGEAPYGHLSGLTAGHLELGSYNLFLIVGMQTLSLASSNHLRQIRHRNLVMEAAGMLPWRWSRRDGLVWGDGFTSADKLNGAIPRPQSELSLLPRTDSGEIPDRWNHRIDSASDVTPVLDVVGRVLMRDSEGTPAEIIGLVKDASADERARQVEIALQHQRALMHGLQARLNPHFLFNSLNIIRALVHADKVKAERAVLNLAKLLRVTLKSSEQTTIPLELEIENIQALMEIAEMRFEERISHEIVMPESLGHVEVPAMLVFNLVENAITHGIALTERGGHVRLELVMVRSHLMVRISNPGTLDPHHKPGVGLGDAIQRLEMIYHGNATLELRQSQPGIVTCSIQIPLES